MDKYSVVQENTTFRVILQMQEGTTWDETTEPNAKYLAEDFCFRHNQKLRKDTRQVGTSVSF